MPIEEVRIEGLEKIAEGWTAEIFALSAESVVKIYKNGFERLASVEYEKTRYLRRKLSFVPIVHNEVYCGTRKGYSMERLESKPLGSLQRSAAEVGQTLSEFIPQYQHVNVNEIFDCLHTRLRVRLKEGLPSLGEIGHFALSILDSLPQSRDLCHGDYHSGNVLVGPTGAKLIDWNGSGTGDINADIAKTILVTVFAPRGLALFGTAYEERIACCVYFAEHLKEMKILKEESLSNWLFVRMTEFMLLPLPEIHEKIKPYLNRWLSRRKPQYEDVLA